MTIKTNYQFNFDKAENDTFSWNSSWDYQLFHKPTGRSIAYMSWTDTHESVTPEIKAAVNEFRAELSELQARKPAPISDQEYQAIAEAEAFERRMDDPNSDL